jgi:hypothetical protein
MTRSELIVATAVTDIRERRFQWIVSDKQPRTTKSFVFRAFDGVDIECVATCVVEQQFCKRTPLLLDRQSFEFALGRTGRDVDSPVTCTFHVKLGSEKRQNLWKDELLLATSQFRGVKSGVGRTVKAVAIVMTLKRDDFLERPVAGTSAAAFASPFLNDQTLSDVVVVCGNRTLHCHKIILAGRSEVFNRMLTGEFMEAKEGRVEIRSFEPDVVENLIKYVYGEEVPKHAISWELFEAAEMYGVAGLRDLCLWSLRRSISVENCARTLEVASMHNLSDVFALAVDFFKNNLNEVAKTDDWERISTTNGALLDKVRENGL